MNLERPSAEVIQLFKEKNEEKTALSKELLRALGTALDIINLLLFAAALNFFFYKFYPDGLNISECLCAINVFLMMRFMIERFNKIDLDYKEFLEKRKR